MKAHKKPWNGWVAYCGFQFDPQKPLRRYDPSADEFCSECAEKDRLLSERAEARQMRLVKIDHPWPKENQK
jgi:hypothetical protein